MEDLDPNQLTDRELLLRTYQAVVDHGKRIESHGKRLTGLETWRNLLVGGGIVVAATWKLLLAHFEKGNG